MHIKHYTTQTTLLVILVYRLTNGERVRITTSNIINHIKAYVVMNSSVFSAGERRDRMMYQRTTNNELCNCTLLTFVPICCLDFPLLNWAGLWSQFTTTDFHSRNFDLIVQTRQSAVSKSRYKSPLCEALSQNLGTSSHCSVSCCCHTVQWPCPSLQANIFSDCYV